MAITGLTFKAFIMQPQAGMADERDPHYVLPAELAGYERSAKSLIVLAVRDADEVTVGVGASWVLNHSTEPVALLVKAAEVNEPYAGKGLKEELLRQMHEFAGAHGMHRVHVPVDL